MASWEQLSLCLDTGPRRDNACLPGSSRMSPASKTTQLGDLEVTSADPARGGHTQPPSEATLGTGEFWPPPFICITRSIQPGQPSGAASSLLAWG